MDLMAQTMFASGKGDFGLVFSQNWEEDFNPKFYQTPQDTAETLNFKTLYNAYLSLAE